MTTTTTVTTQRDAVRWVEERLGADGSRELAEAMVARTDWRAVESLTDAQFHALIDEATPRPSTDPDAYEVVRYDTNDAQEGLPTAELVRESLAAGKEGAVLAYYDAAEARWEFCSADYRTQAERRGEVVRTVYVREAAE